MNARRLVVVWRATERCDTACGFCAYDVRLRRSRRVLAADDALRFGGVLAAWATARGRDVLVSWLGGEPFLWPPLESVSEALVARGLALSLTTNGRALADAAWRAFASRTLAEITVSLDGPPAVHDLLRARPGLGQGVLDAIAALRRARGGARSPLLRVNTVLMHGNVGAFAELVERVAEAGADELTFNALGGNDRPELFPAERLRGDDVARLAETLPELRASARALGLTLRGGEAYVARLGASAAGVPLAVADCAPGDDFWFVEVDGTLAPCSFTTAAYGVPIGDLRTIADLDALPARLAAARSTRRSPWCDDCPSTRVHAKFA